MEDEVMSMDYEENEDLDIEETDDEAPDLEEISSGNKFNAGVAAIGAVALGGAIFGTVKLVKKIKAKRAEKKAAAGGEQNPEKPAKEKGFKLGKNRKVVVIDMRETKEPADANVEETKEA